MIIAHLPAGYLLTKLFSFKFKKNKKNVLWVSALIASIFPDIDIFYFYIQGGVRNHRYYITHWPLFWVALLIVSCIVIKLIKKNQTNLFQAESPYKQHDCGAETINSLPGRDVSKSKILRRSIAAPAGLSKLSDLQVKGLMIFPFIIAANIFLHLALDALAGPIFYAAPFTWEKVKMIEVPAVHGWWVWNFIRHWTFQLELMIWATAVLVFALNIWKKE